MPAPKKNYKLHLDVKPAQARVTLRINDVESPGAGTQVDFEAEDGARIVVKAQADGFNTVEREFIVSETLGPRLMLELEPAPQAPRDSGMQENWATVPAMPAEKAQSQPAAPAMRPSSPMKRTDSNDKPTDLL
jgi:hypothetical protein